MKNLILMSSILLFSGAINAQNSLTFKQKDSLPAVTIYGRKLKNNQQNTLSEFPILNKQIPNNLTNTGTKTNQGFDIYKADLDGMAVLIPNTKNPNYKTSKPQNGYYIEVQKNK